MNETRADLRAYLGLLAQFQSVTLTMEQVRQVVPVSPKTIRNWISAGEFPRPIPGDVWTLTDVADWIASQQTAA